jgi:predicted nucleic acid-binding protein
VTADEAVGLFLDTNVFVADWMLESAAGKAVISEAESGDIRLLIPELVLREARRKYQEAFRSALNELRKAGANLQRLPVGGPELPADSSLIDSDQVADQYLKALRERLASAGAEFLPIPSAPHEEVLARAFLGKPPFDSLGRNGYRDTLIWLSVLEFASESSSLVIVTNDGHFAQDGQLHPELVDDLHQYAVGLSDRFSLYPSLRAAIPNVFPAVAGALFEFNDRLRRDDQFFRQVRDAIDGAWPASAPDIDIDPSIDYDWLDYELDLVNDVFDDFEAVVAAEADDGTTFLEITAHADIQVLYTLPLRSVIDSDGYLPDAVEPRGEDRAEFVDVVPTRLSVDLRYRPGGNSVSDVELTAITEDWDWVEPGRGLGGSPSRRR